MSQYDLSRNVLDRVREVADIIQVIGEVVTLRKAGRNYLGLCPFHGERTPSFNVSREKGTYYCFGCKKGGDVIDFVMEVERVDFPEAVERLASRFGVELPLASPEARRQRDEGEEIAATLEAAQALFSKRLSEDRPRHFLEQRGVTLETAADFGLGYAQAEWRSLYDELHRRFADRTLIAAGLVVEGEGGRTWDRFRDRVTIPIRSQRGRIIAFGGRTLGDDPAKYINSPETPLFSKSRVLYSYDRAVRAFVDSNRAIVVEGYFDCIALQHAGFCEAVATLGTALSEHHARELARKVPEVVVCFDGDNAGRQAARAAVRTLLSVGIGVRVLLLPADTDPDDVVRREGAAGFGQRIVGALGAAAFLVDQMGETRDERRRNLLACIEIVDACPDPVRRFAMREELARAASVPVEELGALAAPRLIVGRSADPEMPPPGELALLRGVLLDVPAEHRERVLATVELSLIENPTVRLIIENLKKRVEDGGTLEISDLTSDIDDRDARRLLAALEHVAPETPEERLSLIMRELWERQRKRRLAELSNEIARAEHAEEHDQLEKLLHEWQNLLKQPKLT